MAPEVSVIIPCYNQAHYLEDAIESVISQTFSDWEAIVIDDGSTDDTRLVASTFKDNRIRYLYQENQGLSAARNAGLRAAKSDIIALLDSDDIWVENYLEKMLAPILDTPGIVAVYCGFQYIDENGQKVGVPNIKIVPPTEFDEFFSTHGNWMVPSGVVFRKSIAEKEGCFDESLKAVEDADLWSKISDHGQFFGIPLPLVHYRRHEANMSSDPMRMVTSHYKILSRYYGPPQGDSSTWTARKKKLYTRYFRDATKRYLAYGDVEMSAYMFLRMLEVSPSAGKEIGTWRGIARVHLPIEIRNAPGVIDWESAEKDVLDLLNALSELRADSQKLNECCSSITGSAYLSLADEAFRANHFRLAFQWMLRASQSDIGLVFTRPYWGTILRGIMKVGKYGYAGKTNEFNQLPKQNNEHSQS